MTRVLTLTMNPAIDLATSVGSVAANRKLRCRTPSYEPGGGGINVSTAMAELGCDSNAAFPCGGPSGDLLIYLLRQRGIRHKQVRIENWIRLNLSTVDESSDDQYRFVMPGPELSEKETGECLNLLRQGDHPPDYLVLSGSLPPGVPPEFMRDCSALAKELNTRLIVDTSGEPLKAAASEGVYLLKPNLRELGELSDGDISDEAGQENAIRGLVDRGACEIAILSLGAAGVVVAQKGDLQRFRAPTVPIVSRVGAGDSMVAGIVTGFCRGYEIRDAILLGIAAGSAAVMTPGTQLCRKEDTERLWNEMRPK